jgi:hypothetical protein
VIALAVLLAALLPLGMGCDRHSQAPSTGDLITLKQAGVPDGVVAVMQNPPQPVVRAVRAPTPVIVEEYHYGYPRHHRPVHHRRHGTHWGVQIGH